jgi:3-hydroxymyristoyl/3-hydroxydecanoyl-(acyl carrier protein) dehydratase
MNNSVHWTVPLDHPALAGHFPGRPILPGVVLLDLALQVIAASSDIALDLCEISSVKFLSPARPGDELLIEHSVAASGAVHFDISAGSRKIASGSIVPELPLCDAPGQCPKNKCHAGSL